MTRTRVKICGITRPEDGLAAARLGADAVGLVFYPGSSRAVDVSTARRIIAVLPPFVTVVGLFVDAEPAAVWAILQQVPLGILQFHGQEDPDYCNSFGLPYIKAVPMGAGVAVGDYDSRFAAAAGLLLDSHGGATPVGAQPAKHNPESWVENHGLGGLMRLIPILPDPHIHLQWHP